MTGVLCSRKGFSCAIVPLCIGIAGVRVSVLGPGSCVAVLPPYAAGVATTVWRVRSADKPTETRRFLRAIAVWHSVGMTVERQEAHLTSPFQEFFDPLMKGQRQRMPAFALLRPVADTNAQDSVRTGGVTDPQPPGRPQALRWFSLVAAA